MRHNYQPVSDFLGDRWACVMCGVEGKPTTRRDGRGIALTFRPLNGCQRRERGE